MPWRPADRGHGADYRICVKSEDQDGYARINRHPLSNTELKSSIFDSTAQNYRHEVHRRQINRNCLAKVWRTELAQMK